MSSFKSLFNPKTIERRCSDIIITQTQRKAAKDWLNMLDANELEEETENHPNFKEIILQNLLGYGRKDIKFEKDNIDYQIQDKTGKRS